MKRLIFTLLVCITSSGFTMTVQNKTIYGYVEKATLVDKNLTLSAKLDTGAKSSSLSAVNIREEVKDGVTYLRFTVPSRQGDVEFIAPFIKKIRIKARAGEDNLPAVKHEAFKRPVVSMKVRIGDAEQMILVNLTNRKRFNYPLLLGRDAINLFSGIIDPSLAFTIKNKVDAK